jgi:hypothetical protein
MPNFKPEIVTMSVLIKSYDDIFSKFGLMILVLDDEHANPQKISIYLDLIDHLVSDLTYKVESVQSVDKKEELSIMLGNAKRLKEHATKTFYPIFLIKPTHSTTSVKKLPHL